MAKRFRNTDRWSGWYRRLPIRSKILWDYMNDMADTAGVWKPDFELATFQTGEKFVVADLDPLRDEIRELEGGLIFLRPFIREQYTILKVGPKPSKIYIGVVKKLKEHGMTQGFIDTLLIGYVEGINTLQDQDQDQDLDLDLDQDQKGKGEQGKNPKSQAFQECQEMWLATVAELTKVERNTLTHAEGVSIAQALKERPQKEVLYALFGYRFEKKTDAFDPADYVNIKRALGEKIDTWINLALQQRRKLIRAIPAAKPGAPPCQ